MQTSNRKSTTSLKEDGSVNLGLLFLKPSSSEFSAIVDAFKTTPYDESTGWGGNGITGLNTAGFLAFYYSENNNENTIISTSEMGDYVISYANHLACHKPWHCFFNPLWSAATEASCLQLNSAWFTFRQHFEEENWSKTALVNRAENSYHNSHFFGYCKGDNEYQSGVLQTHAPTPSPTPEVSDCQVRINHHRLKYGIDLITEKKEFHSCNNRQSQYDKLQGAHKSYKRCGSIGSQGQGGGSTCSSVIDAFFNERWVCFTDATLYGTPIASSTESNYGRCRQACMDDLSCLSFSHDAGADLCEFYGEEGHTIVSSGFIGDLDKTSTAPQSVDGWFDFSVIDLTETNKVPTDGTINEFTWYGSNPSPVRFFYYRHVSDNTYEVVGTARASQTTVGVQNTLTVSPPINVQAGDVMGFTWEGAAAFGFTNSKGGSVRYSNEGSGGPTSVGEQFTIPNGKLARVYHVAAAFVPASPLQTSTSVKYCAAAHCDGHW